MKCFTKEWYLSKKPCENAEDYYSYVKENYSYYPDWVKEFNIIESGQFIFHDALICDVKETENKMVMNMVGIANKGNVEYNLIINNPETTNHPCDLLGKYIIAEELYCSRENSELQLLLLDDNKPLEPLYSTIKFDNIRIKYIENSFMLKVSLGLADFINYFSKEKRAKRKAENNKKALRDFELK